MSSHRSTIIMNSQSIPPAEKPFRQNVSLSEDDTATDSVSLPEKRRITFVDPHKNDPYTASSSIGAAAGTETAPPSPLTTGAATIPVPSTHFESRHNASHASLLGVSINAFLEGNNPAAIRGAVAAATAVGVSPSPSPLWMVTSSASSPTQSVDGGALGTPSPSPQPPIGAIAKEKAQSGAAKRGRQPPADPNAECAVSLRGLNVVSASHTEPADSIANGGNDGRNTREKDEVATRICSGDLCGTGNVPLTPAARRQLLRTTRAPTATRDSNKSTPAPSLSTIPNIFMPAVVKREERAEHDEEIDPNTPNANVSFGTETANMDNDSERTNRSESAQRLPVGTEQLALIDNGSEPATEATDKNSTRAQFPAHHQRSPSQPAPSTSHRPHPAPPSTFNAPPSAHFLPPPHAPTPHGEPPRHPATPHFYYAHPFGGQFSFPPAEAYHAHGNLWEHPYPPHAPQPPQQSFLAHPHQLFQSATSVVPRECKPIGIQTSKQEGKNNDAVARPSMTWMVSAGHQAYPSHLPLPYRDAFHHLTSPTASSGTHSNPAVTDAPWRAPFLIQTAPIQHFGHQITHGIERYSRFDQNSPHGTNPRRQETTETIAQRFLPDSLGADGIRNLPFAPHTHSADAPQRGQTKSVVVEAGTCVKREMVDDDIMILSPKKTPTTATKAMPENGRSNITAALRGLVGASLTLLEAIGGGVPSTHSVVIPAFDDLQKCIGNVYTAARAAPILEGLAPSEENFGVDRKRLRAEFTLESTCVATIIGSRGVPLMTSESQTDIVAIPTPAQPPVRKARASAVSKKNARNTNTNATIGDRASETPRTPPLSPRRNSCGACAGHFSHCPSIHSPQQCSSRPVGAHNRPRALAAPPATIQRLLAANSGNESDDDDDVPVVLRPARRRNHDEPIDNSAPAGCAHLSTAPAHPRPPQPCAPSARTGKCAQCWGPNPNAVSRSADSRGNVTSTNGVRTQIEDELDDPNIPLALMVRRVGETAMQFRRRVRASNEYKENYRLHKASVRAKDRERRQAESAKGPDP